MSPTTAGPQIGIDADHAPSAFAFGERGKSRAHRLDRHRIGAEGQCLHIRRQLGRQISERQPTVGRALAVKSITLAMVVGRDHRDRRQPIGTDQKAIVDALANEGACQQRAETIARDSAKESRIDTKPGEADGDVERRASGDGARRHLRAFGRSDEQIDQRFTTDDDHAAALSQALAARTGSAMRVAGPGHEINP
jgi:hypothetical protein